MTEAKAALDCEPGLYAGNDGQLTTMDANAELNVRFSVFGKYKLSVR